MGWFDKAIDAVGDVLNNLSENRTDRKKLKYEKQLGKYALKTQGKTLSGVATGDSAYSSAADTMVGFGSAAQPIADVGGQIAQSYMYAQTLGAAGKAGASGIAGAAGAAGAAVDAGAGQNTIGGEGGINVQTAAILGVAALALVFLGGSKGSS